MKLIDKSALAAEIERRINKELQSCATDTFVGYSQGCVDSMRNVLSFLDTLEVKEVDLEKEISKYIAYNICLSPDKVKKIAKYFFELGLRAQKGE